MWILDSGPVANSGDKTCEFFGCVFLYFGGVKVDFEWKFTEPALLVFFLFVDDGMKWYVLFSSS